MSSPLFAFQNNPIFFYSIKADQNSKFINVFLKFAVWLRICYIYFQRLPMLLQPLRAILDRLLIRRSPSTAAFLKKSGLEYIFIIIAMLIWRRRAVAGVNLFAPDFYRHLYAASPKGFWAPFWHYARYGEEQWLNPTYFFNNAWFRRTYKHLLPEGVSPLVFFMLRGRDLKLKPHWKSVFWGTGLRVLGPGPAMSERFSLEETRLNDISESPGPSGYGWFEADITGARRVDEYARAHGLRVEAGWQSSPFKIAAPFRVYSERPVRFQSLAKIGFSSYIAEVRDVLAIGGDTALRAYDGSWLKDGVADRAPQGTTALSAKLGDAGCAPRHRVQLWRGHAIPTYEKGLFLMQRVDTNYNIWMTTCLTRLLPLLDTKEFETLPIFISEGMPPTHEEILRLLAPANEFIRIPHQMVFLVRRGIFPSEINRYYESAQSDDMRNGIFRVDVPAMRELARRLFAALALPPVDRADRKILLHRANYRIIKNSKEIYGLARQAGFEIIQPEKLSFKEQVDLFRQASHILGPAGAAMTNLIFAPEGSFAATMHYRDDVASGYHLWQAMAAVRGVKLCPIIGERAHSSDHYVQENFYLPPSLLQDFLSESEAV